MGGKRRGGRARSTERVASTYSPMVWHSMYISKLDAHSVVIESYRLPSSFEVMANVLSCTAVQVDSAFV